MITGSLAAMAARGVIGRLPWRYIGLALAAAGVAWAAYSWAWQRGHDSRAGEVALLTAERNAARANVGTLKTALQDQSAAIDKAGSATKAAQDKAAGAARKAQERAPGLERVRVRLDAVPASGGRCDVPDAVAEAWRGVR